MNFARYKSDWYFWWQIIAEWISIVRYKLHYWSFLTMTKWKKLKVYLHGYICTVKSVLEAAASNHFDEFFGQNLLSKKLGLLRLLFEGGFYLRAASNTDYTVDENVSSLKNDVQVRSMFDEMVFDSSLLKSGRPKLKSHFKQLTIKT